MKELVIQFWPQLYVLFITTLISLRDFFFSGQVRMVEVRPVRAVVIVIFELIAVIYGGFFAYFGLPQFFYLCILAYVIFVLSLIFYAQRYLKNTKRTVKHTVSPVGVSNFVVIVLLFWGDYFNKFIEFIFNRW